MISNIFYGKTNYDCVEGLIEKLKQNYFNDPDAQHLFIVPDRISVLTEVKIFNKLNIDSTCNIRVLTLSRLASIVVENMPVIPKTSSCMIFQKLLKDNRQNLKCFNKHIDSDLATCLFDTVSQFKSCRIPIEQVCVNTKNKILEDKLSDIALLYSEYQKHLKNNNLIDSLDRLDFVSELVKNNDFIKSSYIYIGNFDSFTFQGFQIIGSIMKVCREFNIGLVQTDSLVNAHIYDEVFKNNILKLFEVNNIEPQVVMCRENVSGEFKHLQDNLFGFNNYQIKIKESKIKLFEGKTFEEEVLNCASKIKDLIINKKYKFSDFVVCVCSLAKRAKVVDKIFKQYNFSYYIDSAVNFNESVLIRFLNCLVDVVTENFSRVSVLSLLKNALVEVDREAIEDFEDYLIKYNLSDLYSIKNSNVSSSKFYENFNSVRNYLFEILSTFITDVESAKTYKEFIDAFEGVLVKLEVSQKLMNFATTYTSQGNIKQAKLFEQYYSNLTEIFDNLREVLGKEECDLKLFHSTILSGVSSTKISTTPLSTNSLFVGDSSTSFYDKSKVYFVLGADEKSFPFTLNDCGLISDKEISQLSDSYKLEPTVASINLKERFKCFELLLKPTEKLFLSYNYQENGAQKSKILNDVSKMFSLEDEFGGFDVLPFDNYESEDFLIKNNNLKTARNNALVNIRGVYDGNYQVDEKCNTLFNAVNSEKEIDLKLFDFKNDIKLKKNYFFGKNTVSVSQVESFMSCPFLHFVRYGLRLKEKDEGELDRLNIGTILHDIAKDFSDKNKLPIDDSLVKGCATKSFDKVMSGEVFESIKNNPMNKVLIQNLLQEAIRFCSVLNYQAKYSKFKTMATEIRFDDKKLIKSFKIKINNHILSLVGQVDRIDTFKDYFRIIDYKTGKCDTSLRELFFGKKVQLEAYVKVVGDSLKLKPAGAYYLPVKSSFADDSSTLQLKYQLKGNTISSDEVINASDTRLESDTLTSDIIQIRFNKNDSEERTLYKKTKVLSSTDLENVSNYAISLIGKACEDILKLDITPKPLVLSSNDDPCKNCKHFALCRFDENFKNYKRSPKLDVEYKTFSKGDEE
ncbi:MAG: PD-(D/E)XK nuclease family protein [Clostridia bacterium]|nr:PD-(D/E)XK nuclease family protein [Clostridia bacterium]